jgi:nicotinamidase-related amidase
MKPLLADANLSVVVSLDLQQSLLNLMENADRIADRSAFLVQMAHLFDIPVIQSEQNPSRLGSTHPHIQSVIEPCTRIEKMDFSATRSESFMSALKSTNRRMVVMMGIETHICVVQTVCGLISKGYEVFVCTDALGSRTTDRHEAGLERLKGTGAILTHTESVAYEWLRTGTHPKFKEALKIVKASMF